MTTCSGKGSPFGLPSMSSVNFCVCAYVFVCVSFLDLRVGDGFDCIYS